MNDAAQSSAEVPKTSDESIGRPAEWREGRYEKSDEPLSPGVAEPERRDPGSQHIVSTPVTPQDYRQPEANPSTTDNHRPE